MNGQHRLVDGNGFRGVEDRDETLPFGNNRESKWMESIGRPCGALKVVRLTRILPSFRRGYRHSAKV